MIVQILKKLLILAISATLVAGCSEKPNITAIKPRHGAVEATVTSVTSGAVRAENIAELAFGTVGRVKAIYTKLGAQAKRGEILAELENEELLTALDVSERDLKRVSTLLSQKLIAQSALDEAKQKSDFARAALEKSYIRAPYDGLIGEMNLEVGQLSQITTIIPKAPIKILDNKPRYIRAEIDEVDLAKLKVGMQARVTVMASKKEPFEGTLRLIVPFVSAVREQDRTCEIEVEIPNSSELPVGASADVEIVVESKTNVLTIPSRSIFGRGTDRFVYVVESGEIKKRAIARGIFNYEKSEVTSGISESDLILLPNDKLTPVDGMSVIASEIPW